MKTEDDNEKAEILSKYFSSVFVLESSDGINEVDARSNCSIEETDFGEDEVIKAIKNLRKDKSPGPDGIHPRIIKECVDQIILPLQIIFQQSFNSENIPEDWKKANIISLNKKGDKSDPGNYRPVSLTSIVGKLMESVLRERLIRHLKENDLISNKQFGFVNKRSATLQLIKVMEYWTNELENGNNLDVIYFDFKKAFDTVPHRRLVEKIKSYNISSKYLNWIKEFLANRKQRVVINDKKSEWKQVMSGVPQGSVLGPLLFVLYINDLPDVIKNNSEVYLYADDTKLFRSIKSELDVKLLQEDINKMKQWSEKWLLEYNNQKCKVLRIGPSKISDHNYYLYDELQSVNSEKDIGIIIDNKLKFSDHITEKVNKANRMIGLIRRTFATLDKNMFLKLYVTLIRPILEYANQVWNPYYKKDIDMLENVQRRATKMIPGLRNKPYEERLKELNLPSLAYRRSRGDMIETFKIISGFYDSQVTKDMFQTIENYNTRGNNKKIYKPFAKKLVKKNSFCSRIVNNWNDLPDMVVNSKNVIEFEKNLDYYWRNQNQKYCYEAEILKLETET